MSIGRIDGAPHWVRRWIGLPFRLGGRGPEAFDCWGLLRAVYAEQLAITLPSLGERYSDLDGVPGVELRPALAGLFEAERSDWRELAAGETRAALDAVLIRRGRHACHVGLIAVVDRRGVARVLHIEEGTDSVVVPIDGPQMARHVVGVFRHRAVAA